jgi:hypothetical protein
MFAVAVVTAAVAGVEWVAVRDTHQAATRVPEAHSSIRVESSDARQFLIGKVGANPVTNGLFRVLQLALKSHAVLLSSPPRPTDIPG